MNKKGLSDIVATILIVLLALAAVGIVAGFLLPIIRDSGDSATLSVKCLDSEVEMVSCVHNSTTNQTRVLVRLVKGGDVKDVVVGVDYTDGSTETNRTGTVGLLATKDVFIHDTKNVTQARAYPVIGNDEGDEHVCQNSPVADCTNVA